MDRLPDVDEAEILTTREQLGWTYSGRKFQVFSRTVIV
jgi:hypothetical protein